MLSNSSPSLGLNAIAIMTAGQRLWEKDELILAINLYCKLPFGKMHARNPAIIDLAHLIGRTPSSVSYKLVNFASMDPSLQARGIKGAANASKLDRAVWDEFYNNWDAALLASEDLLANRLGTTVEVLNAGTVEDEDFGIGLVKERMVKTRVNQNLFRKIILATYNNACCITGLQQPELLVASHIVPWSIDHENRLNPMNGLCLNALHDKAFDRGLLTIDADSYEVILSARLQVVPYFSETGGRKINLPDKFLPDKEMLRRRNDRLIF
jgi:putative restriction endonuclease